MTLSTERVFLSDAGAEFVCSAQNDFGSEEVLHVLSVTGKIFNPSSRDGQSRDF